MAQGETTRRERGTHAVLVGAEFATRAYEQEQDQRRRQRSVLLWVKASNERWARLTCSDVVHSPTQMPTAMAKRRGSVQLLHRAERAAAGRP